MSGIRFKHYVTRAMLSKTEICSLTASTHSSKKDEAKLCWSVSGPYNILKIDSVTEMAPWAFCHSATVMR